MRVQLVSGDRSVMEAVKFMSHNDLGIYLHDTPWPSLRAAQRALSAGAERWEDAPSDNGLQVETVQKRADSSAEQPVDLSEPVLLYLLYRHPPPLNAYPWGAPREKIMAGPQERYGDEDETTSEIAPDDVGASATAERLNKAVDQGDAALSDGDRAMAAMASRHERFAGSAVGVGSTGFGEQGVYTSADGAVGDDEELLIDGQEEVFSRTEVEQGRIEHHAGEDGSPARSGSHGRG
nr:hypothetical protein [Brevundimonas naejangsanensis]